MQKTDNQASARFGDVNVEGVDDVLRNWDSIKMDTKGQETFTDTLKSVPKNFPALMRAQKLGKRAAKSGLDFEDEKQALESLKSEIAETEEVLDDKEKAAQELGDVLFSCVNVARKLGLDAEELLDQANEKFLKRFENVENSVVADGQEMTKLTAQELDSYWRRAKN